MERNDANVGAEGLPHQQTTPVTGPARRLNPKRLGRWAVIPAGVLIALLAFAVFSGPSKPRVAARFVQYTNTPAGGRAAILEIANRNTFAIARDGCRIFLEGPGLDKGFWYAAEVRSKRLDPGEVETVVVPFGPQPMKRWQAVARFVRNPNFFEEMIRGTASGLAKAGLSLPRLGKWCEARARGEAATAWVEAPAERE